MSRERLTVAEELPKWEFLDTVMVGTLAEQRKNSSILKSNTEVSIFSRDNLGGPIYELFFHLPIKKKQLNGLLKNFSTGSFKSGALAEFWSQKAATTSIVQDPIQTLATMVLQNDPDLQRNLAQIGEIIDSEDDSEFVSYIENNIQTHLEAWEQVSKSKDFLQQLARFGKTLTGDVAERVDAFVGQFPATQVKRGVRVSQNADPITFENFLQKPGKERVQFIWQRLGTIFNEGEEFGKFQKDFIHYTRAIHHEFTPGDQESLYILGNDKDVFVSPIDSSHVEIHKGRFAARVDVESDGNVIIQPRKTDYLIPTLVFQIGDEKNHFALDSQPVALTEEAVIPRSKSISIVYPNVTNKMNSLAGLLLMYDYLELDQPERISPVLLPFAAISSAEDIVNRRLFDKIVKSYK